MTATNTVIICIWVAGVLSMILKSSYTRRLLFIWKLSRLQRCGIADRVHATLKRVIDNPRWWQCNRTWVAELIEDSLLDVHQKLHVEVANLLSLAARKGFCSRRFRCRELITVPDSLARIATNVVVLRTLETLCTSRRLSCTQLTMVEAITRPKMIVRADRIAWRTCNTMQTHWVGIGYTGTAFNFFHLCVNEYLSWFNLIGRTGLADLWAWGCSSDMLSITWNDLQRTAADNLGQYASDLDNMVTTMAEVFSCCYDDNEFRSDLQEEDDRGQ